MAGGQWRGGGAPRYTVAMTTSDPCNDERCPGFDPGPVPNSQAFAVVIPRRAVDPRGMVRAAEVWRMAQEAAVQAMVELGWSPELLRDAQVAFVVSDMTVVHHRQAAYGERIRARTWVRDVRRATLVGRAIRLWSSEGPISTITQRWAHVSWTGPDALQVCAASAEILAAMPPAVGAKAFGPAALPAVVQPVAGPQFGFRFEVWHTWMDPIGHVNHPSYLDFLDEALCRQVAKHGGDPQQIDAVAERLRFRQAATAGQCLAAELRCVGLTDAGDAVLEGRVVRVDDGAELIRATLVRSFPDAAALLTR